MLRQSPRHAAGAMLPPPPRATKKAGEAEDSGRMTDDDMNSWLLNGPMAGPDDDDPGGWQYGSMAVLEGSAAPLFAKPQVQREGSDPSSEPKAEAPAAAEPPPPVPAAS